MIQQENAGDQGIEQLRARNVNDVQVDFSGQSVQPVGGKNALGLLMLGRQERRLANEERDVVGAARFAGFRIRDGRGDDVGAAFQGRQVESGRIGVILELFAVQIPREGVTLFESRRD